MNKLIVALCASAFAFGSVSALADSGGNDMKPLSKMETQEAKAARAAAKEKWAKMTPEEQAAAKKAAAAKNRTAWTATEEVASGIEYDTKQAAKDTAASKAQPKPTAAERQQYGTTLDKKASTGQ
jgi:FKBP-type peptidyl-prolyl cis-trans isomerase